MSIRFGATAVKAVLLAVVFCSPSVFAALSASVTLVSGDPTDIYPGESTRLQITLSNSNSAADVNSVAFSTTLPGSLPNALEISGASTYQCTDPIDSSINAGVGTLTAVVGTQTISLAGGVIDNRDNSTDGTCVITVPVTAGTSSGGAATYAYQIGSDSVTGNDGGAVSNSGAVSQSINVSALSKPTITKNFADSSVYLGGSTTRLTITVANSNPVDITGFSVTDTFPQLSAVGVIKVAATPNELSSCTSGSPTFSPNAGDTSLTATGDIPADGSCTFAVDVEANHTDGNYSTGSQTNRIHKSTDFTNDIEIPAQSNATDSITVLAPLSVSKSFANATVSDGGNDFFTITLTNQGSAPLTVASFVDDQIDGEAGFDGLTVTGHSSSCTSGTDGTTGLVNGDQGISYSGGVIGINGGTCTITVNFAAKVTAAHVPVTYTNSIGEGDVDVGNIAIISQSRSASILVADDLRVFKSASPAVAVPGGPVRYTVTIHNYASFALTNVTIKDTLPVGMTYLTGVINGNDYSPLLPGPDCSGLVDSGSVGDAVTDLGITTISARTDVNTPTICSLEFWAMVPANATGGASTQNTLTVGDVCYNSGAVCNGSAVSSGSGTNVNATVASATKRFNGATNETLPEGTIATMQITISNLSANELTNVTLSDTFPIDGTGQLEIANPANASTTCGSPTIAAVAGTTSLSLNGATVPARANNGIGSNGSCVVNVDVLGPAGIYPNVAQIDGVSAHANGSPATIAQFDTDTATLNYTSSLSAVKSFSPANVSSGGVSTVRVRVNNSGATALTSVSVIDPLPTGMVLADPVNAHSTCAGAPVFTSANPTDNSLSFTGASLAGNGTCDILFDVIASGSSDWVNTIPSGNITADGGVINVSAVAATLNYDAPTNLTVAKATSPSTLTFPGETSELTITINNGSDAVTNLSVIDYFTLDGTSGTAANGMEIAATVGMVTTCSGGIVSALVGSTQVGLSGVSLAAGASCTLKVNVTSTAVGGVTNYIPVGAITTDQGLTNSGQASTSLTTQSNVGIAKQFEPNIIGVGERSRLRITLYNPTEIPISDLSVTDSLPVGVTVPSGANPTSNCVGASVTSPTANQVQVSGANLAGASGGVAASCYAEIDVTANVEGDFVNTIPAGAITATSGGAPVTNSTPASDTLRAKSSLSVHKAFDDFTLDAGDPVGFTTASASAIQGASSTLTIRLDNPNAADLTGAALIDALPSNLVVAQTPNASTTCANGFVDALASSTHVRLSGATIPATGFCTLTVDVLSNVSGSYINTIGSGDVTTSEGVTNEEPTRAELIVSTPPAVDKQFSPAVIASGGTSKLTIVFDNENTSAITLTSAFVDTLPTAPGNIVVAAIPNVGGTCPGSVTAAAGSGSVTYANGAAIPVGGCTITLDVTGTTTGEHINNIPAGDLQTNVGNNQSPANSSLTISPLGFVAGRVFADNDVTPNGSYDEGTDTPIEGVSIELYSGADCSGSLVNVATGSNPTTTDSLGNYLFSGLSAGTYSVCEPVQPSGTTNGITSAGSIASNNGSTGTAGIATNPTDTSSQVANIVINNDGTLLEISGSIGNDFAEIIPSSLSGIVFKDENNNGVKNGADIGLSGVIIELLDGGSNVIATTTTDTDGAYSFTGLAPGSYSIREPNQPNNTANGLTLAGVVANGGTDGSATLVTTLPSVIAAIILPPNTDVTDNNFAEIPEGGRISGQVFLDYDNNAALDGVDHGIGGQTINLTGTDINGNPVSKATTTDANGNYSFDAVAQGSYTVTQPVQPTGTSNGDTIVGSSGGVATAIGVTPSAISTIVLSLNEVSADNNFAEQPVSAPDLAIEKNHSPDSFGDASSTGIYTITPSNIGPQDTSDTLTIVDTLPAGISATSVDANVDWSCSITDAGQTVTCTSDTVIESSSTGSPIIVHVSVASGLAGQVLVNTVVISGGGEPVGFTSNNSDDDPTPISDSAQVSGTVWRDEDHDRVRDPGETVVGGWEVELLLNGVPVRTTFTAADGSYSFSDIAPGAGYQIAFRDPETGASLGRPLPNESGGAFTPGVDDDTHNPAGADNRGSTLDSLSLLAGDNIQEQSLPLDPSGVVYNSITRAPVAGATVVFSGPAGFDPATDLVGGAANATQLTADDGYYEFLLFNTAPVGTYTIVVTEPAGYLPGGSQLIPVCTNTPNVGAIPDPAMVQVSNDPPIVTAPLHDENSCPSASSGFSAGSNTTQYYLSFVLDPTLPSGNVLNNHIPLDPILGGAITVVKEAAKDTVSRGEFVPYTITAVNNMSVNLSDVEIVDRIPPGFKYVEGSASLDSVGMEPVRDQRELRWLGLTFAANQTRVVNLLMLPGSGVSDGKYTNSAWAEMYGNMVSNVGTAVVEIVPDPTFDCSDIIGKVFDDKNLNGYQDEGEAGLADVRLVTVNGELISTDAKGRYHVACAATPDELRGQNYILKLDTRTLPSGYRVTTENPRVVRLTRGKVGKLNFGSAIHRVVRADITAAAFKHDKEDLTDETLEHVEQLVALLRESASVLRIAYHMNDAESKDLVRSRMDALQEYVDDLWSSEDDCCYDLQVEKEIVHPQSNLQPEPSARQEAAQ